MTSKFSHRSLLSQAASRYGLTEVSRGSKSVSFLFQGQQVEIFVWKMWTAPAPVFKQFKPVAEQIIRDYEGLLMEAKKRVLAVNWFTLCIYLDQQGQELPPAAEEEYQAWINSLPSKKFKEIENYFEEMGAA